MLDDDQLSTWRDNDAAGSQGPVTYPVAVLVKGGQRGSELANQGGGKHAASGAVEEVGQPAPDRIGREQREAPVLAQILDGRGRGKRGMLELAQSLEAAPQGDFKPWNDGQRPMEPQKLERWRAPFVEDHDSIPELVRPARHVPAR